MIEKIVIFGILFLAILYMVYNFFFKKKGGCDCGCQTCEKDDKNGAN
ncbi:MAG: FeoB-associated Cys-rich membrane protein [Campylobacteraceae bacterium]